MYELSASGLPVSRAEALAARHVGNGVWELADPVRIEITQDGIHPAPADRFIQLGEAPRTAVKTKEVGVAKLLDMIYAAQAGGYDTTTYQVDVHVKIAAPLACLLLPAVVLLFAIGGPPGFLALFVGAQAVGEYLWS